jgi:hypothetical protein
LLLQYFPAPDKKCQVPYQQQGIDIFPEISELKFYYFQNKGKTIFLIIPHNNVLKINPHQN